MPVTRTLDDVVFDDVVFDDVVFDDHRCPATPGARGIAIEHRE